jgi:hypothetical protein
MNFDFDHERYVNKNRSTARGYEVERRDSGLEKKGFSRSERGEEASCFNCKLSARCAEFRAKRSGGTSGAVSFGGRETFVCDRFIPKPKERKRMDDRQIKSLLKNAKRGL